jgi:hypothetical protein
MRSRFAARVVVVLATAVMMLTAASTGSAVNIGDEGCTPGFWKNNPGAWEGYSPTQTVSSVFSAAPAPDADDTLMEALQGGGGAVHILLRASVAAFLNAEHEGIGYPYRRFAEPGMLHAKIQAALASGDRATMLELASWLDAANNLGCPLKADEATQKAGKKQKTGK